MAKDTEAMDLQEAREASSGSLTTKAVAFLGKLLLGLISLGIAAIGVVVFTSFALGIVAGAIKTAGISSGDAHTMLVALISGGTCAIMLHVPAIYALLQRLVKAGLGRVKRTTGIEAE